VHTTHILPQSMHTTHTLIHTHTHTHVYIHKYISTVMGLGNPLFCAERPKPENVFGNSARSLSPASKHGSRANILDTNEGRNTSPPAMRGGSRANVLDQNDTNNNASGSGSQRRLNSPSKSPSAFGASRGNLGSAHEFSSSIGGVTETRVFASPGVPYSPHDLDINRRSTSPGPRDSSRGRPETRDSDPGNRDVSRGRHEASPTRDPSRGRTATSDAQGGTSGTSPPPAAAGGISHIRFPSADGRGPRRPSGNGHDYPPYMRDMSPTIAKRDSSRGRQRFTPEGNRGLPPSGRDSARGRKEGDSSAAAWDSARSKQGFMTDRPGQSQNGASPEKRSMQHPEFYVMGSGKIGPQSPEAPRRQGAAGQDGHGATAGSQSMRNLLPTRGSPGPVSPVQLGSARFIF
jgi:hypothetical protein